MKTLNSEMLAFILSPKPPDMTWTQLSGTRTLDVGVGVGTGTGGGVIVDAGVSTGAGIGVGDGLAHPATITTATRILRNRDNL